MTAVPELTADDHNWGLKIQWWQGRSTAMTWPKLDVTAKPSSNQTYWHWQWGLTSSPRRCSSPKKNKIRPKGRVRWRRCHKNQGVRPHEKVLQEWAVLVVTVVWLDSCPVSSSEKACESPTCGAVAEHLSCWWSARCIRGLRGGLMPVVVAMSCHL